MGAVAFLSSLRKLFLHAVLMADTFQGNVKAAGTLLYFSKRWTDEVKHPNRWSADGTPKEYVGIVVTLIRGREKSSNADDYTLVFSETPATDATRHVALLGDDSQELKESVLQWGRASWQETETTCKQKIAVWESIDEAERRRYGKGGSRAPFNLLEKRNLDTFLQELVCFTHDVKHIFGTNVFATNEGLSKKRTSSFGLGDGQM